MEEKNTTEGNTLLNFLTIENIANHIRRKRRRGRKMQEGLIMREEKRKKKRKKKKKKKKKKRKEIWQCFVMEENKGLRQCVEKRMKLMR